MYKSTRLRLTKWSGDRRLFWFAIFVIGTCLWVIWSYKDGASSTTPSSLTKMVHISQDVYFEVFEKYDGIINDVKKSVENFETRKRKTLPLELQQRLRNELRKATERKVKNKLVLICLFLLPLTTTPCRYRILSLSGLVFSKIIRNCTDRPQSFCRR